MSTPQEKDKTKSATRVKKWHPPGVLEPDKANWNKSSTEQFFRCVIEEFNNKNRGGQYLNSKGYNRVIKSFYDLTGKFYDRQQIKNKYDSLKRDWMAWNQLKSNSSTGLCWDPENKTFTAPGFWWEKMNAINPYCQKFEKVALEHEELLDQIFTKTSATGKTQFTPDEEFQSEYGIYESTINIDDTDFTNEEYYETNQSQSEMKREDDEYCNKSGTKRTVSNRPKTSAGKDKRSLSDTSRKSSTSGMLQETMSTLVNVIQNQGNEVVIKQHTDTIDATIPK